VYLCLWWKFSEFIFTDSNNESIAYSGINSFTHPAFQDSAGE